MYDATDGRRGQTRHGAPARIVVIDDHPLIRQGITALIGEQHDLEFCGAAAGVKDGLELVLRHRPDVALVDISLQDGDGIDVARRILKVSPSSKILIISVFTELVYARRALAAGASGFISKLSAPEELLQAIQCALSGKTYVSREMGAELSRIADTAPGTLDDPFLRLSMRELQVFKSVGDGKSTVAIAAYLGISVKTVETHRASIKRKLGLASSHELKECAIRWALKARD